MTPSFRRIRHLLWLLPALVAPLALRADATEPQQSADQERPLRSPSPGAVDLESGYREVYLEFATGERQAAVVRAATLERAAFAASRRGVEVLDSAERKVVVGLAKERPGALYELFVFYQDLAGIHAREGERPLHSRANRTIRGILDTLAERVEAEADRRIVSAAYQGWAVDLLESRASQRAGEALVAALALLAIPPAAAELRLRIVEPPAGQALFGEVQVSVEISGGEAGSVALYYDGARVRTLKAPPWTFRLDVGEENVDRILRSSPWGRTAAAPKASSRRPRSRSMTSSTCRCARST